MTKLLVDFRNFVKAPKKCILTQSNMAIVMYVFHNLSYYPRSFIKIYMTIMAPKDTSLYKCRLSLQSKKKLLTNK